MFHFPCCSKRLKHKNKHKKHPGVKAPRLHIELESLKGQWPSVLHSEKKKRGFDSDGPRPPELRQSTSATNLDPRGNKKHQKVGFEEQHFWMKLDFFNVERKKAGFCWDDLFLDDFLLLRMLFESYFFDLFGSFWMSFF